MRLPIHNPQKLNDMTTKRDTLIVRRTSTGLGLCTTEPITPGERIVEYTGPRISREEADTSTGKYLMDIDKRRVIDGSPRTNIARYINHSCAPNAEAISCRGRVWIWSKAMIETGEAITIHYGEHYFDEYIKPRGCRCAECRVGEKAS